MNNNSNIMPDHATQSANNDYFNMMIKDWEQKILTKIKTLWAHHASYVYICIYGSNALGIETMSMQLKAIADVQKLRDEIMNDLNKFLRLIQEMIQGGFGDKNWIPKDHKEIKNREKMAAYLRKWLSQSNDQGIKGPNGKTLSNYAALQYIWKDLFGKNGKGGLVAKLKNAMNDPWYKQKEKDTLAGLTALNSKSIYGGSSQSDWTYQEGSYNGFTFLDFLRGKGNLTAAVGALERAMIATYYKNNNTKAQGDTHTYQDDASDMTSQVETSKQTQNASNQSDSTHMSELTQEVTSIIQTLQKIVENGGNETRAYVSNQEATG